ncbi:MAG: DUF1461 domain-containing protein [Chloroflexi bacterium]|nr:DUF1461 domain-containing protein [Chloroflexota bacterium]
MLFGLGLAAVILLAGPLLLFNPWAASALQARHGVAAELGATQAEVDRVTGDILVDLYVGGSFDVALDDGAQLLDERERSHMADVSRLVQILVAVGVLAAVLAVVMGAWLRGERHRQGRIMVTAAGIIGIMALVLAIVFAVAFEPAFLAFHAIFFPPDTYLFAEGSQLIVLFPQGFWFDAALVAGTLVILTALVVTLIGFARWRGGRSDARPHLI